MRAIDLQAPNLWCFRLFPELRRGARGMQFGVWPVKHDIL